MKLKKLGIICGIAAFTASMAQAQTLATWNFNSGTLVSSSVAVGMTASNLGVNAGVTNLGNGSFPGAGVATDQIGFGGAGNPGGSVMFVRQATTNGTTFFNPTSRAVSANLFSFTVTALANQTITVTGLRGSAVATSHPYVLNFAEANAASFATAEVAQGVGIQYGTAMLASSVTVTSGQTKTFVIGLSGIHAIPDGNFNIDDFVLQGSIIPEPSTALLGGLGVLALLRRRR
jgi:PEP-CTERM motif